MIELTQGAIGVILFIAILSILVLVHEVGHFVMARRAGVRVHEFGVGFPPRARVLKNDGDTLYTLNWLPIGGFVRLEGEEGGSGPRAFSTRPAWQRLIVLASGAVVNLLLPVVLFAAALMIPHDVQEGRATITEVIPRRCCSDWMSSAMRRWLAGSSPVVGSS